MRTLLTFAGLTLLILFTAQVALANDPSGWWNSSTGSQVQIQAELTGLSVRVTTSNGQTRRYQGQWTDMPWRFQYFAPGFGTYHAAFDGNSSSRIRVNCPDGSVSVWTRSGNGYAPPQRQAVPLDGIWVSSSGNTFQVTTNGNQVFVSVIDTQGRRSSGMGRWIQKGYKFDYTITGYRTPVVGTIIDYNHVQVNNNGTITRWERAE